MAHWTAHQTRPETSIWEGTQHEYLPVANGATDAAAGVSVDVVWCGVDVVVPEIRSTIPGVPGGGGVSAETLPTLGRRCIAIAHRIAN